MGRSLIITYYYHVKYYYHIINILSPKKYYPIQQLDHHDAQHHPNQPDLSPPKHETRRGEVPSLLPSFGLNNGFKIWETDGNSSFR